MAASWDGRMRLDVDQRMPRLAYINATHPATEGAQPLEMGSDAEAELIDIFDTWVQTEIPPDSLDAWLQVFFDYTAAGNVRREKLDLKKSQERALRVARTSRFLKRQRELGRAPSSTDL